MQQNAVQTEENTGYWKSALGEIKRVRTLAGAGMLAALAVALRGVAIPITPTNRVSLATFPLAIAGFMYGPFVAGMVGIVKDLLGYLLNPTGPFFPGFTLIAFVEGFLFGLWLYKREVRLWRVLCAVLSYVVLISLFLNPLMLSILMETPLKLMVLERLIKNLFLIPVYTALIYTVCKVLSKQKGLLSRTA